MAESGHSRKFSTRQRLVWNAAMNRHSAPNVDYAWDNLPPMNGRMLPGAALRLSWRSVSESVCESGLTKTSDVGRCPPLKSKPRGRTRGADLDPALPPVA